mmetsp:Transcript_26317/g.39864  ORF Transcript_26317/g.39864 Transcript_26317/m.39864 type:complete len:351 (+) Transcript_26317:102-1154(+)|eukprot:CAMPEP_0178930180 /NCGR_PEP_ID=MMETSP0786-20121207/21068_1 /TAXON_ID=186022 /ORGANISM="Thalassionema frauenfeldii, Strain CCMP 1798" /LENGTH=350 /DNA_ID=CAMNT_0020606631 /DNA_START=58 /DNA_END=1110 /DNA_ORIENTATION=-
MSCITLSPSPVLAIERNSSDTHILKEENAFEDLRIILHKESTAYSNKFDYLSFLPEDEPLSVNDRVSEGWRRKICEWSFEVVDHFGFDRGVVSIALNYLDRVVALKTRSSGHSTHRREFQLIAVTSLYLAIKLHGETDSFDGPRRKLKIQAYVTLSRGLFSVETLEAKELEILELLQWNVNPPSSVQTVASILRLIPEWSVYDDDTTVHTNATTALYEMARYLTELAVCVSTFSFNYKPSQVAYAAILCSIDALQHRVHIPYGIRVEFMNKVTAATNLTPQTVASVRALIMDLCPSLFPEGDVSPTGLSRATSMTHEFTESDEDGKISPVCVMAECRDEASPRKRGRPSI